MYARRFIIDDTVGRLKDKSDARINPLFHTIDLVRLDVYPAVDQSLQSRTNVLDTRGVSESSRAHKFPLQVRMQTSWTYSIDSRITLSLLLIYYRTARVSFVVIRIAVVIHGADCQNNSLNFIESSKREIARNVRSPLFVYSLPLSLSHSFFLICLLLA